MLGQVGVRRSRRGRRGEAGVGCSSKSRLSPSRPLHLPITRPASEKPPLPLCVTSSYKQDFAKTQVSFWSVPLTRVTSDIRLQVVIASRQSEEEKWLKKWSSEIFRFSFIPPPPWMTRVWSDQRNVSDKSRVGGPAPQGPEVGRVRPSEDLVAMVQAGFHRGEADEVDKYAKAAYRWHVGSW